MQSTITPKSEFFEPGADLIDYSKCRILSDAWGSVLYVIGLNHSKLISIYHNYRKPVIVLYRIPLKVGASSDNIESIFTLNNLLAKKEVVCATIFGCTSRDSNFALTTRSLITSNVLLKSKKQKSFSSLTPWSLEDSEISFRGGTWQLNHVWCVRGPYTK